MNAPAVSRHSSERTIVFLVGAVQFVNILDFMMVMPMGPDFAAALNIPTSSLGLIGGSYTAAACVTGLAGAFVLDRFDRRSALGVAMVGLVIGTLLGGAATGLGTLLLARVIAGAFGGPATSIALSIISDKVPSERRGKAMGAVMGAFSIASVLGVPAGLKLARIGGWRMPFFSVGAMGFAIAALAVFLLPPMRDHMTRKGPALEPAFADLFRRPVVLLSYAMTVTATMGMFALIPNISAHLQRNLGYPRADIETLYFIGGIVSFGVLRVAGRLVDRLGSTPVAAAGTLATALVIWAGFVRVPPPVPVLAIFVGFMACTGLRNVAFNTLTSRVPRPAERARFMSIQSAAQHAASAFGAVLSSQVLFERADGHLERVDDVAWFSIVMVLTLPVLMFFVERSVVAEAARAPAAA
jgi:predicted MFS family arabinose efflux permease